MTEATAADAAAVQQLAATVDDRPQITYPSVGIDLLDEALCPPGQRIMMIQNRHEVMLFPMPIKYAQQLGQKLCAPSVQTASPAEAKAAAKAMGLPR